MSFNRLLNEENAKPSYYKEPEIENKNEKSDFTEEELMLQWRSMCNRMAQQDKLRGMASRMKNLTPVITEYPNIEVIVESKMLLDEMNEVRNRIRVTLAHNLHNSDINFNIRLAEQEEIKPQMSRREILTHLQQENAAVNRLTTALGLELA